MKLLLCMVKKAKSYFQKYLYFVIDENADDTMVALINGIHASKGSHALITVGPKRLKTLSTRLAVGTTFR